MDSVTWRASSTWGAKLGYSEEDLENINLKAIQIVERVRNDYQNQFSKFVISGCLGPQGDGYKPTEKMNQREAQTYHMRQIETFAKSNADMVTASTITYSEEAIGIVRPAANLAMPVVISFAVETDGNLPLGETLKQAIEAVDNATDNATAYFMLNCAHPLHFDRILQPDQPWAGRLKGIRANASRKSHADLDESDVLDEGNPAELGRQYKSLTARLPNVNILGGCCGTDHRHIEEICKACT